MKIKSKPMAETKKKTTEKVVKEKTTPSKYIQAIGRRKEAIATVRLSKDKPQIIINDKNLDDYFPVKSLQNKILEPFTKAKVENKFLITVKARGGGLTGQAEAIRLGISRALVKLDNTLKPTLKKYKLLTRDSRVVERKKYGLKKARKRPQWAKR